MIATEIESTKNPDDKRSN